MQSESRSNFCVCDLNKHVLEPYFMAFYTLVWAFLTIWLDFSFLTYWHWHWHGHEHTILTWNCIFNLRNKYVQIFVDLWPVVNFQNSHLRNSEINAMSKLHQHYNFRAHFWDLIQLSISFLDISWTYFAGILVHYFEIFSFWHFELQFLGFWVWLHMWFQFWTFL